jgi:hypothetical protein
MIRCNRFFSSARLSVVALMAGGLAAAAVAGSAWAGMPLQPQVSGQVSAVQGATAVTINGTTYLIAPNSPASTTVRDVTPGQTIGLVLNGPPGAATSEVVYITRTGVGTGVAGGHPR